MEVPPIGFLGIGKSQSKMNDLGVPPFQETPHLLVDVLEWTVGLVVLSIVFFYNSDKH